MSNRVSLEAENNWAILSDNHVSVILVLPEKLPDSDIELLQMVNETAYKDSNIDALELLDYVMDTKKGMQIRDTWYDYDEIKNIS